MRWKRRDNKLKIEIEFDRETEEIKILVIPANTRPIEILQTLMLAINTINDALQEALEKEKGQEKHKEKIQTYVS